MEAVELRVSAKPFEVVAEGPPNGKVVVTCECNLMECVDNYTLKNLTLQPCATYHTILSHIYTYTHTNLYYCPIISSSFILFNFPHFSKGLLTTLRIVNCCYISRIFYLIFCLFSTHTLSH